MCVLEAKVTRRYFHQGKKGVTLKNYDEHTSQRKAKIYTQHVPIRQNTEEKVQGKELKTGCDDENG